MKEKKEEKKEKRRKKEGEYEGEEGSIINMMDDSNGGT